MGRSYEPCMCGAPDCPRCFPGHFVRFGGRNFYLGDGDPCEACDGTGHLKCDECEHAGERDADGLCQVKEDGECPECPECHGQDPATRAIEAAEAAMEDEAERRADARRERDWD